MRIHRKSHLEQCDAAAVPRGFSLAGRERQTESRHQDRQPPAHARNGARRPSGLRIRGRGHGPERTTARFSHAAIGDADRFGAREAVGCSSIKLARHMVEAELSTDLLVASAVLEFTGDLAADRHTGSLAGIGGHDKLPAIARLTSFSILSLAALKGSPSLFCTT